MENHHTGLPQFHSKQCEVLVLPTGSTHTCSLHYWSSARACDLAPMSFIRFRIMNLLTTIPLSVLAPAVHRRTSLIQGKKIIAKCTLTSLKNTCLNCRQSLLKQKQRRRLPAWMNWDSCSDCRLSKVGWEFVVHATELDAHLAILPSMSSLLIAKSSPRWIHCPLIQRCLVHPLLLSHLPTGISDLSWWRCPQSVPSYHKDLLPVWTQLYSPRPQWYTGEQGKEEKSSEQKYT